MIKVENVKVYNLARAVYSARNPLDSWAKSDSDLEKDILGEKDLDLAKRLCKAGSEHRKFLRQIFVTMDIIAPRLWYHEFDTYKIGTVVNSCSTMHTIHKHPFTKSDFSFSQDADFNDVILEHLNKLRQFYLDTDDKIYWRMLIDYLPQSFNQKRTVTMNYEIIMSMIHQRKNHKLIEWVGFTNFLMNLPYVATLYESCYGDKRA